MKCEICGLKDAVIHIRQIQKDLVHELHICEECAQEKGLIREEESELPIANLLSGLLEGKDMTGAGEVKESCPSCGLKASEFRKQGKLGCAECFQAFEKDVKAIVSQMAARPRHRGGFPARLPNRPQAPWPPTACGKSCGPPWSARITSWPPGCATGSGRRTPMFDFTGLADMKGWMRAAGEGVGAGISTESPGGVVISSRVRLARNLRQYPFPAAARRRRRRNIGTKSWRRFADCRTRKILR